MSNQANGQELKQYIERAERLDDEAKQVSDAKKDLFAEIKARGYDVKALKVILSERKQNPDDVAEQEAVVDLYKSVMGM